MWFKLDPNVAGAAEETEVSVVPGGLLFKVTCRSGTNIAVALEFVPCVDAATWLEDHAL